MTRHYYFKRSMPSKPVRQWLYKNIKKRIPKLIFLAFLGILGSFISVAFALISKDIINYAVAGDREGFVFCIGLYAALIIVEILMSSYSFSLESKLTYWMDKDLKVSVFHDILKSDFEDISRFHSGEVIQRVNADVTSITSCIISIASSLVAFISGLVIASAALYSIDPIFTLCIIPVCVLLALMTVICQRDLKLTQKEVSKATGKLSGFYYEIIEKLLIVQGMGIAKESEKKAEVLLDHRIVKQRKLKNIQIKMNIASNIFGYAGSFVALIWCSTKVLKGLMDYGSLLAATTLVGQVQGPILSLPFMIPTFIRMTGCAERVLDVVTVNKQEEILEEDPHAIYDNMKSISAENVVFAYPNQEERKVILSGLTMSVYPDEMTVFTGTSGCGKSTMLKLLLGIYRINEGQLFFEMKNGERIPVNASTRNLFSFAPQGNLVLSGTIRENIMIANPEATEEELRNAVYVSAMDEYIKELPDGLDTELGENGAGLSEGQVQRINIARAVLKDAPIMLLDEVTSSLDIETERKVLERIHAIPGKTCIAVTHRPAALELSGAEVHFENGKATEKKLR